MIKNKLIIIKKQNVFDKGWDLFAPFRDINVRNRDYHSVSVNEIIGEITYAQTIVLFMAEPCLPYKVMEELKWVSTYAKIYLIAKTDEIATFYDGIRFTSIKTDDSLSLNYIRINVKEEKKCYFIAEGFQRTDDILEKLYGIDGARTEPDFSALATADYIILSGDRYLSFQNQIFEFCREEKITAYLAKSMSDFCKTHYDQYVHLPVGLIVADKVKEGIYIAKQGKLFCASIVKGHIIAVETENISAYISGDIYINLKCKEVLHSEEIPQNVYILQNCECKPLTLKDCLVMERQVSLDTMEDFISEKFDSSEIQKHNQYSAIAKSVEYRFTLVPPLYDKFFEYSDIYSAFKELLKRWKEEYIVPIECIKNELELFDNNDAFIALLRHIEESNETVEYIIDKYNYKSYRAIFSTCRRNLIYDRQNLLNFCNALNEAISTQVSDSQNLKIDDEIAGYGSTIREKEACIAQGKDVLQNKRRIEILKKKIEELKKIKERFSTKQSENITEIRNEFTDYCRKVVADKIDGKLADFSTDSISSVVSGKEMSKKEMLNVFVQKWLRRIDALLKNLIDLLASMEEIDVPEDYIVYDLNGERFIVINDESEYYDTKDIQAKYMLQCVGLQ